MRAVVLGARGSRKCIDAARHFARLIKVMDDRLAQVEFLAGDYSIADIATYPWVEAGLDLLRGVKSDIVGARVARWLAAIGERPAARRGMAVPAA